MTSKIIVDSIVTSVGDDYVTAVTDPISGKITYSVGLKNASKPPVIMTNIYSSGNSERIATGNSNTTPAVTYEHLVPTNKFGILTGSKLGTSGNTQQNLTTPSDTAYYVYSFVAYVPYGVTGAKVIAGLIGFHGGDARQFTYDWDDPLTSAGVYSPVGAGLTSVIAVDNIGGGFRRFHAVFKNTNINLFIDNFSGSAATNKVILSGFQLVRIPDDGTSTRIDEYIPLGLWKFPYSDAGKNGVINSHNNRFPFRDVSVFSDSIWGAAAGSWRIFDSIAGYFCRASLNSYGGYTTEQVCQQFDLQNVNNAFDNSLVIFNCGRNDGLSTENIRNSTLAALDQRIQSLGHDNYKVCGVLLKFACISQPGTEETTTTNIEQYNGVVTYNMMLAKKYGEKFIDLQAISLGSYNPLDAADIAAVTIGMRPPSLAPTSGDGLHPGTNENMVIGSAIVNNIKNEYGVL